MIRNTPSNWITNGIYVGRNKKFTYDGRMWQPAIFDTKVAELMLFTSRQVGKSTAGGAHSMHRLCTRDNYNILFVAPEMDQARKYSQDKIKPMIEESPVLKSQIGRYNNVHEKEFRRGGKLYMKYAKDNADRCRGITAQMVHYDEIQDQNLDLISPVIDEVLFTSMDPFKLYTGTPKSTSNTAHKKWIQTDQREWLVRCHHHSPVRYINLKTRNIGKRGPICHHCGNLLDVDDGLWVKYAPENEIAGFHVNQLHCKISHITIAKWKEIIKKYEEYPDYLFLNEVMGESADSAENPITEAMLRRACENGVIPKEESTPEYRGGKTYAGIDWGHGMYTTQLVIGRFHGGKFQVIFMKAYEGEQCQKDYCIPDMARIINSYGCRRVHVDYGGGYGMWDDLNEKIRPEVTGMMWTNAHETRWKTTYEDGNGEAAAYSIPMLSMNRTRAISRFVNSLRNGEIWLPHEDFFFGPRYGENMTLSSNKRDKVRTFAEHFLALRKEVDNKKDTIKYERSGPDDALHATIYAWAIALSDNSF